MPLDRWELGLQLDALRAWADWATVRATQAAVLEQMADRRATALVADGFRAWAAVVESRQAEARAAEAAQVAAAAVRVSFRGWAELAEGVRRGRAGLLASCLAGWRQAAAASRAVKLQVRPALPHTTSTLAPIQRTTVATTLSTVRFCRVRALESIKLHFDDDDALSAEWPHCSSTQHRSSNKDSTSSSITLINIAHNRSFSPILH